MKDAPVQSSPVLARRLAGIELSEIVQLSERASRLKTEGHDIVSLGTGEPDLPTPPEIVEAAHAAALRGETRYPPTAGTGALRDAIAARAGTEPSRVIVSTGAKQVIANAMLATLDPGDEVVIPAPFWTSYADIVRLASGTPVILPCPVEDGFKLRPDALEAAITPRTRWLMLNSPSNPSGAVYSAEDIAALAAVLERNPRVWVLSDEIYRELAFVSFASFTDAAPNLADRTLIVDGVSKAWSMTGWRIGWGVGPASLISAMVAVQGQLTSGACSIAQVAAVAALGMGDAVLDQRRAIFRDRRDRVVTALQAMPGLTCASPEGAFYAFPGCAAHLSARVGRFDSDAALCAWLLDAAGVAVVPGRAFGLPGHLRLSFAYSDADLTRALDRMADAFERISR
jgi:aspartate aminotransferase